MGKRLALIVVAALAILAIAAGCSAGHNDGSGDSSASQPDSAASHEPSKEVLALVDSMTLRQKVSQMMWPAIRTWSDDGSDGSYHDMTEMNDQLADAIADGRFGGIILFASNTVDAAQTVKLIDAIQDANARGGAPAGLFIGVDQEGGYITRLATGTMMPSTMGLGATGDPSQAKAAGNLIGEELAALGFNVDLAPVMDVNNNPQNPIIGIRSFSDDPDTVAAMGSAFMEGLHEQHIAASLKHFPGHGDTQVDSHTGLPMIDKTADELASLELVPFKAAIDSGADMVMTAHIQYPSIETEMVPSLQGGRIYVPATLSHTIITGILREQLGFDGIVLTDSLYMDAIAKNFEPMDAAKRAINAGVDMMLDVKDLSSPQLIAEMNDYIDGIVAMVERGEISEETIDAAVTRILACKEAYGLLNPNPSTDQEKRIDAAKQTLGSADHHARELAIAEKGITLLKNDGSVLPIAAGSRVVVACPYDSQATAWEYAIGRMRASGDIASDTDVSVVNTAGMGTWQASDMASSADVVIAVSSTYQAADLDPASQDGAETAFVDALIEAAHANGGSVVVVSAQLPYDTARFMDADAIVAAYLARGMTQIPVDGQENPQYGPSMIAAADVVFGAAKPEGKLPVDVPALDDAYHMTDAVAFARGSGLSY